MDLKEQLAELKTSVLGKSAEEVKAKIDAFEVKYNEHLANEIKAGNEALKAEFDAELKKLQDQADAMDVKLQAKQQKEVKTVAMQIGEKKAEFKSLEFRQGGKEVEIKADTLRASIDGNQQAMELADIGQLAHRKLTAYDAFVKIPVSSSNNNGTIRYYDWDQDTIVRAANMVAEGQPFPESTAKWVTEVIDLKKVGDTLPVSEEFYEDEAMFAAELGMFLETNVNIKIDDQIVNGDGTGNNLKGMFASVDAYVAAASGITDASIYDLVPKVTESITKTGGSKYMPNVAFMNKTDINKYKLKKDANNNYVMPPFVSRDGQEIDGVLVIENNSVTANSMIIGDNRFARIYEKGGMTLQRGTVDAQFNSDMETLKVRKRLLFLIRGADKGGWKKVTDIDAALLTLQTP